MEDMPAPLQPLFQPRPAPRYLPHGDHAPENRHTATIHATGPYMAELKAAKAEQEAKKAADKAAGKAKTGDDDKTWFEKNLAKKLEMDAYNKYQMDQGIKDRKADNETNPKILKNKEATIIIFHLNYMTTEKDLLNHFRSIGPIDQVRLIQHDPQKSEEYLKKFDGKTAPKLPHKIMKRKLRRDRKFADKNNSGTAFLSFKHVRDAEKAAAEMQTSTLNGRLIGVEMQRGNGMDKNFKSYKEGGGRGHRNYTKDGARRQGLTGQTGTTGTFHARGEFFARGGGGFRGGRGGGYGGGYGGRGGIGYRDAPDGAPAGPRGGGRSGYGGGRENGHGGRYEDRDRDRGASGTNMEPLGRRDRGYGGERDGGFRREDRFHDRERDRDADSHGRRRYDDRDRPSRDYDRGRDDDRKRRRYDDDDARDGDPRRRRM